MDKFFIRVFSHLQGLDEAKTELLAGKHRHDVLEKAIRALEVDPRDDTVGYGGFPNIHGKMELDGAFMDGDTRNVGTVIGISTHLPVRVARKLMEQEGHVTLAGAGAEQFAGECGLKEDETLLPLQRRKWEQEIRPKVEKFQREGKPLMNLVMQLADFLPVGKDFDTTHMIVGCGNGMSSAASTSGWPYKYPGRAGDAPISGAGFYVDSDIGGAACVYTGEMAMRTATSRYVVTQLELGKSPREAVHAAIKDITRLKGGLLGTLTIHAISRDGDEHVAAINADKPQYYCYWRQGMPQVEVREAEMTDVPALRSSKRSKSWRHLENS